MTSAGKPDPDQLLDRAGRRLLGDDFAGEEP